MKRLLLIGLVFSGFLYAENSMPVMYGGYVDEDACGSVGEIRGINKHGDGFLSVRRGAGTKYKIKDKIRKNGSEVIMCDEHGKWVGVVYGKNCGTGSPIAKRQPYRGNCRTGWIYEKYVVLTAG